MTENRDATAGVSPSLESAYRRYSAYVAAISLRLLGRDDEVDDVVQDVFLSALRGLHQLRDEQALRGWLATVAVRVARRRLHMRRIKAWLGVRVSDGYDDLVSADASVEDRVLLCRVYELLDELPVNERIAWVLRTVQGEQLEDVARLCSCSLATAKRRIAAAQSKIEGRLRDA